MLILIAGPVRSGTHGDPALIHANLEKMNRMALEVYQRGHTPVIGEWLALPQDRRASATRSARGFSIRARIA